MTPVRVEPERFPDLQSIPLSYVFPSVPENFADGYEGSSVAGFPSRCNTLLPAW
jgi:hypothetical protein